jgi:hypothetical protein
VQLGAINDGLFQFGHGVSTLGNGGLGPVLKD